MDTRVRGINSKELDFARFARREAVLERALARVEALRAERDEEIAALRRRLGIHRELGTAALDILANIVVEDGHWRWPRFNSQGTPVAYMRDGGGRRAYRGAASAVHEAALGCQHGTSYKPICGHRWCVNPAHRCGTCHARAHRR